jgi:hypothetical protein
MGTRRSRWRGEGGRADAEWKSRTESGDEEEGEDEKYEWGSRRKDWRMATRKRTGDGTRENREIHLRSGGWEDEDEKRGQKAGLKDGVIKRTTTITLNKQRRGGQGTNLRTNVWDVGSTIGETW